MNLSRTLRVSKWLAPVLSTVALLGCGGGSDSPQASYPSAIAMPQASQRLTPDIRAKLDAEIQRQMDENSLPGVVVSISIPGEGSYRFVKGTADLTTGRPRLFDDPIRIASITKTFVGLSVLRLVDQGKLQVTDTIDRWFPDFPNARRITVDNLLRMRSGIVDPLDDDFLIEFYANPMLNRLPEEFVRMSADRAAEFIEPDTETDYNNLNAIMLQLIAERLSGLSIRDLIAQEILRPLALDHTFYPIDSVLPGGLRGYSFNPSTGLFDDKTVLNAQVAGGAGAMISTVQDLQAYVRVLCKGSLLKLESHARQINGQQLSHAPSFIRYGEALVEIGEYCGHNGTVFGFSTDMFYLEPLDATVVVSVNRLDLDDSSKSTPILLGTTRIVFPDHVRW